MDKKSYISHSDDETQKIGTEFATELVAGDVVFLYGDLGYGKTTFVKGAMKGLGIQERVISPTFTIIRTHGNVHHIDLYRLEGEKELEEIGLQEILNDSSVITFIEWPEKIKKLPQKYTEVIMKMNRDNTRTININKHD